jgi:AbrB family looped-hinge helix DNA binding protein
MVAIQEQMVRLTEGLPSKSAKMRALATAGYRRGDIARFLGTSPQFVRNVLVSEEARKAKGAEKKAPAHLRAGDSSGSIKIRVGPDGRVVIPAAFREHIGLKEGDVLFARLEDDGEIHLLTPKAAMRRAQAIVRKFVPDGVSLVDELLEDRRREVEREEHRG